MGDRSRGRFATPADFPLRDIKPVLDICMYTHEAKVWDLFLIRVHLLLSRGPHARDPFGRGAALGSPRCGWRAAAPAWSGATPRQPVPPGATAARGHSASRSEAGRRRCIGGEVFATQNACSQSLQPDTQAAFNSSPSRCEAFSEKRMAPQPAKVIHPASHPSATAMACLCMPTVATTRPSLRARTSRITRTVAPFTRVVPPVGARKSQVNAAPPLPSAWTARAYTPHISPQCDAPRCTLAFHLRFFQVRHVRNRLGSTYGLTRAQ